MKLLELTLLEIDYLKPSGNGFHEIYLSGQMMKGNPIGIWKRYKNNLLIQEGTYEQVKGEKT